MIIERWRWTWTNERSERCQYWFVPYYARESEREGDHDCWKIHTLEYNSSNRTHKILSQKQNCHMQMTDTRLKPGKPNTGQCVQTRSRCKCPKAGIVAWPSRLLCLYGPPGDCKSFQETNKCQKEIESQRLIVVDKILSTACRARARTIARFALDFECRTLFEP